ncbi:MAG: hypothetical protein EOS63_03095 [Mesorhizobium sp.]|uniref:hypothetical protein n=2 Tax=unclassified Mesorhizobium TaxID=325217 RepID=UPI000FEA8A96|nr:hypothetical protein [Mesorhizobium sp.]RWE84485.1 MAG: hypothetical protein EOS63_03095 [Mesorhizobium sp.]TIT12469.1 MAG: hypothetical protein E5W74_09570 [Mesorhizobium sp.]TJW64431.1 MAG: hypothetical protein E5V97_07195 [Mesorhizobium sp.]
METLRICIAAFNASDLTKCAPVGLSLDAWATILGMSTLAILGMLLRGFRFGFLGFVGLISKALARVRSFIFGSNDYREMCRTILPLMEENGRIFEAFGPKSSAADEYTRFDQSLWVARRVGIVENNRQIANIILKAKNVIPEADEFLFDQWLSHIDAFESHVADERVDYRNHQFPRAVVELIHRHA